MKEDLLHFSPINVTDDGICIVLMGCNFGGNKEIIKVVDEKSNKLNSLPKNIQMIIILMFVIIIQLMNQVT